MLLSLASFVLGSGISGGAPNVPTLIAGRTVQGLGGGGILVLMEVILCDLLPLRERPKYLSVILSACSLGVTLGPTIGGAFASRGIWRWAFYIDLPIAGLAFIVTALCLKLRYQRVPTWKAALLRTDFLGNFIFIASTCSVMVGLIMGGTLFPWSSWRIILPIILGGCGWIGFQVHQSSRFCQEPIMPARLFSNRTAGTGFFLVFISAILLEWTTYFIPYYFQALQGASALLSGVYTLPFDAFFIPAAGLAGGLLFKFGQYKPIHWWGFAVYAIAAGLFSTMDSATKKVEWVFWQIFAAFGLGPLISSTLPAIQSSLPESDVATSVGTHAFLRSFGFVWGFTVPSIILDNLVSANIGIIKDSHVQSALADGGAYSQVGGSYYISLTGTVREETLQVYTYALRGVWYAAAAFSVAGFFAVFVEKHIELRTTLETEFGLEESLREVDGATLEKRADRE